MENRTSGECSVNERVNELFGYFERFGDLSYGEETTQLEHALQAGELARQHACSDELIAAALLHDIGQFIDNAGNAAESLRVDAQHEIGGAQLLSRHFERSVSEPVRLHVQAKRYLAATEPGYLERLSDASSLSLRLQGGEMTSKEVRAFQTDPFFEDAVKLRRFDDMAKRRDCHVPDLASYRPLLRRLIQSTERACPAGVEAAG